MEAISTAAQVAFAILGALELASSLAERLGFWDRPSEWDRAWDDDANGEDEKKE